MQRTIEGAGVPLSVHDHGDRGAPVVLVVHGMASDAAGWAPTAERFAGAGRRAITYDRRGYGASGAPEPYTGTTVAEQTADALAVLDALDVTSAIVAGDGFGALVALDLALRFGGRVTALVGVDAPLFLLVPGAARGLAQERAELEAALRAGGPAQAIMGWLGPEADADRVVRAQASALGFFADYAGLASLAVTRGQLRAIGVPSLVATSAGAPDDVVAAAEALAALVPGARREHACSLTEAVLAVAG